MTTNAHALVEEAVRNPSMYVARPTDGTLIVGFILPGEVNSHDASVALLALAEQGAAAEERIAELEAERDHWKHAYMQMKDLAQHALKDDA